MEIRLGCFDCDRDDFDGIPEIPDDWEGVGEADDSGSVFDWQTHFGLCPDCQEED